MLASGPIADTLKTWDLLQGYSPVVSTNW